MKTDDPIFFTAINPNNVEEEDRINIEVDEDDVFKINGTPIDSQQLAELGMLFFALAHQHGQPDLDSCGEALDGFSIPIPVKALQELINIEKEYNGT